MYLGSNCPNCEAGWIMSEKPMDTVKVDGNLVYGEAFKGMTIGWAEKCPVCNGGEAIIENIKKKADIPTSFADVDIDHFDWDIYGTDTTELKKFVMGWMRQYKEIKNKVCGMYLWSETRGSGKTYLASAISNSLIKAYKARPKFVSTATLIDHDQNGELDEIITADVLVLDDIGQKANDWMNDILFRITDYRMQNKKVTLFTSNTQITKLPFDDRVTDRIYALAPEVHLPEYCVRSRLITEERKVLLKAMGLI